MGFLKWIRPKQIHNAIYGLVETHEISRSFNISKVQFLKLTPCNNKCIG